MDQYGTWIKQYNRTQAPKFCLVHFHLSHLGNKFCKNTVKDGAYTGLMSWVAMNCQACCQDDTILNFNRPVGKSSYEQLIPTCKLLQQFKFNGTLEAKIFASHSFEW